MEDVIRQLQIKIAELEDAKKDLAEIEGRLSLVEKIGELAVWEKRADTDEFLGKHTYYNLNFPKFKHCEVIR